MPAEDNAKNIKARLNPFPGLRSFGIEESHLFFGREGQSEIVLDYLAKNRFAAVTGASGSGKSSLIYCGVIPLLHGGFILGSSSKWDVVTTRPGNQPVKNLAKALMRCSADQKATQENIIYSTLRRSSYGLVEAIEHLKLDTDHNLLLIFDQFEELFRFKESRINATTIINETESYIKLIVNAINQRKIPIYVVITMRSDFIGECSQFQEFTRHINESNFLVPQMTREDFRRAVLGPVAVARSHVDPQLVQQILNTIGDKSDQLPVLQHAMMRTWDYWLRYSENGTPIGLRDYEAAGKMENALSMHANEAYEELDEEGKDICKVMFKALTDKGQDNKGTRHPATVKEIADIAQVSPQKVIEVADKFRKKGRSFLTPSEKIVLDETVVLDISHESLMRVWDKLKMWVEEEASSVQMYLRLSEAASLYQLGKTGLWRPPDLHLALNWQKTQKPTLTWAKKYNPAFEKVMVFLDASEKKFLQEEQSKVKLQRRTLNRTRRFAASMFVVAIIITALGFYAVLKRNDAIKEKKRAEFYARMMEGEKDEALSIAEREELEKIKAQYAADSADRARMEALLALKETEEQKQQAYVVANEAEKRSEQLALTTETAQRESSEAREAEAQARERQQVALKEKEAEYQKRMLSIAKTLSTQSKQISDKNLKTLLAYQAYLFNKAYDGNPINSDIYTALYDAYVAYKGGAYNARSGHAGTVKSVDFLGSGNIVYSSGMDGKILRWDIMNSSKSASTLIDNPYNNHSLAVSKNKRWLACGTGTSIIQLFNLNHPGTAPNVLIGHERAVIAMCFVPGKNELVSAGNDQKIILWNLITSEKREIASYSQRIRSIAVDPGGNYVIGGTEDGKIIKWDINTGSSTQLYNNTYSVRKVSFNSSGTRIAFGDKLGNIRILNAGNGRVISQIRGHTNIVNDVEFSPNNRLLASSSMDGTLKIWDARNLKNKPIHLEKEHNSRFFSLAFSSNGHNLVASNDKGMIYIWPTSIDDLAYNMCRYISRNFTRQEWDSYIGRDIEYQKTCSDK
jgi:WD40 repeat protein